MKQITLLLSMCFCYTLTFANALDSIDLETYLRQNNLQPKISEDGLYYLMDNEGRGDYPKTGDYVMVSYVGKLLNGTVFDQSGEEPFIFQLGYRQVIRGWEKGIPLFKVGSIGTLYIPPHLGYSKTGAGKVIPPNAALIYEIEVLKIMDYDAYDRYMAALEEKERIAFEKQQTAQFSTDKKLIHEYASSHKLKTKRLSSGVSYSLKKKGKGTVPRDGDIITFHYEGFLLDDKAFDSSYKRKQPFTFQFGKGKAIKGLEEALGYFKKGSVGWILIPSRLAYGPMEIDEEGIYIPGNSVLIFKVKVLKIDEEKVKG
ncbi:MAG: FKBP-type peptidyl-prolyl cis-trans isomerase FkpA [Saprospiraceae bacterium]|jgi:FKBP-type peptidyl-prolyl cis-trans isomerase FkpA